MACGGGQVGGKREPSRVGQHRPARLGRVRLAHLAQGLVKRTVELGLDLGHIGALRERHDEHRRVPGTKSRSLIRLDADVAGAAAGTLLLAALLVEVGPVLRGDLSSGDMPETSLLLPLSRHRSSSIMRWSRIGTIRDPGKQGIAGEAGAQGG